LNALSRLVQRGADLTVVTNTPLADHVAANGGRAFVLPDPIPCLDGFERERLDGQANLLFICTYAMDEPYAEVFEAARSLSPGIRIHVSGNYAKRGIDPAALAPNLVLTGYLSEEAYVRLLRSVDATIDLTTRENCLVCGAYESIAAGKPMVLSKTRAIQAFFPSGAVYTDNSAADIRRCIEQVLADRERLAAEIAYLRQQREAEWEQRRRELLVRVRGAA
jgi:glycosyltransferase involved in cell wall biosynthesis